MASCHSFLRQAKTNTKKKSSTLLILQVNYKSNESPGLYGTFLVSNESPGLYLKNFLKIKQVSGSVPECAAWV